MNSSININVYKYYTQLYKLLKKYQNKEIVFFCVGNYKIWYDSFSSELSSELKKLNLKVFIYGGQDFPILPDTLSCCMQWIENKHPNACVVVVDNLLTIDASNCGDLIISERKTNMAGLTKNLAFGNVSVLLKTYPYEDCYSFLKKQRQTVLHLTKAIKLCQKII